MKQKLPADAWDTLEFVAEVYKGIGSGGAFVYKNNHAQSEPLCPLGMVLFAAEPLTPSLHAYNQDNELFKALQAVGFNYLSSDKVVRDYKVNVLKLNPISIHFKARMPFLLWADAMEYERGD